MMASAVALRTRDLAVGYRTRRTRRAVLEHVNLAVDSGELVCLLGANGIGKSTLLRTIARMQPPLRGSVELGGADLRAVSHAELARRLGVVLTERVAVDALTVRQIVGLGRYPHSGWFGGLAARDRAAVDWAIEAVGVRDLAARDFDEPTAFLDVPSRVELMGLLRRLTRGGSLAVIVSTHDLELALRTADTIWLLMPGGDIVTGAPEDVVLCGAIGQAFEGRQIRFHQEERSFRLLTGKSGVTAVHGAGLRASLAVAVLEREGFEVATAGAARPALAVHALDAGWRLCTDEGECRGTDFASLAACLRRRRTGS